MEKQSYVKSVEDIPRKLQNSNNAHGKQWKDFQLHRDIVDALYDTGKPNPTKIQSQALAIVEDLNRKKSNLLIRGPHESGKTMAYLIPILNSIEVGLKVAQDKPFKGKTQLNEIFKPQAIIIVSTTILQDQMHKTLKQYQEFGNYKKSEKLKFKVGRMDQEKHEHGDIIVCLANLFLNRFRRGNLILDNCKFIAIDEVEDIFTQEKQTLTQILEISEAHRPNLISCSAIMYKRFTDFYESHAKNTIMLQTDDSIQRGLRQQQITLEGGKNSDRTPMEKREIQKNVIGTIFSHIYEKIEKKPQVFVFFDSTDQIRQFDEHFQTIASDLQQDLRAYLPKITTGIIEYKKQIGSNKVAMTITENTDICLKKKVVKQERPVEVQNITERQTFVKKQDKTYIKSKKKWKDFKLHADVIDALYDEGKPNPTRVQSEALEITANPDRKKFNLLILSTYGSGKTMSYLIPILNFIEPNLKTAEDKSFKGKIQHNEIFKPQGIIIVQTNILQDQLQRILKQYQQFGENKKSEKLKFKIGRMDKEKHEHGDIIVCMPKSFMNRYQRGNLNLENCKFIAIDEVDDIFEQEMETLAEILKICEASRPNVITCSATMKKEFASFYKEYVKDVIMLNINKMVQSEHKGQQIILEGVKHYYKVASDKSDMHKYVIGTIFKHLYQNKEKKPQLIVFFDSIDQIIDFQDYFKARASDFFSDQSAYLADLTVGIIATEKYEYWKKMDMTITEKTTVLTKFRNNETNILLATNIIARGFYVRNVCFVINIGPPKTSEKDADIDLDIYIHRARRSSLHNDKGVALTLIRKEDLQRLVGGIKKIHRIEIHEMKNPKDLVNEVKDCIKVNSE